MFGCKAAVKHTLLESKRPKYLGMDNRMINVELMSKLYLVIAHNLNEARKARDGKKKEKNTSDLEKLKIGDNVLIRDHTLKAFQPKYKDFCIIGFLGKNQIEVKDNHGHKTKVHRRDIKKIPMTEKICQLYEEEQVNKCREGRKAIARNKMADLGWDIAETQLETLDNMEKPHEPTDRTSSISVPFQTIITLIVLTTTILQHITTGMQELMRKTIQVIEFATTEINRSNFIQNIKEICKSTTLVITIVIRTIDCNSHSLQHRTINKQQDKFPGTQKLTTSTQDHTSCTPQATQLNMTSTTSRSSVLIIFTKNRNMKTPEH